LLCKVTANGPLTNIDGCRSIAGIAAECPARYEQSRSSPDSLVFLAPLGEGTGAAQWEIWMSVHYNDSITFGRAGTATRLNSSGIDFGEDTGRSWTSAPVAELECPLSFPRQDVILEIDASPFTVPGHVSVQKMFIFLGGAFVGYTALAGHAVREFPVNRNTITGRSTRLALVIPTAASPSSLGLSDDLRELGIYLASITFKATT
jgi:hypothetical protein